VPVVDLFTSLGMDITVWKNQSIFWEDGNKPYEKLDFVITNETTHRHLKERHRHRQRTFYQKCLQTLHDEGMNWTTLIDIDEYISFNHFDELESASTWCDKKEKEKDTSMCGEEYESFILPRMNMRAKMENISTVADIIRSGRDDQFHKPDKPCILLARYLFSSQEQNATTNKIQLGVVADGFNISYFHTLRYQHRASLQKPQWGKAIMNVAYYRGDKVVSPHRLFNDPRVCTGVRSKVHNSENSLRVHHYVGSWESFRRPGFDSRGASTFLQRNKIGDAIVDKTTGMGGGDLTWLARFVMTVGTNSAFNTTQKAIIREMEARKQIELQVKETTDINWNKINRKKYVSGFESVPFTVNNNESYEEGLPILVVGMPKVGTTSITEFFECSRRYRVSHHKCTGKGGHGRCGVLIRNNVLEGRPPLQGTGDFDVYAQMDAFALSKKKFDYSCYMPQVEILKELHAHYPNATLVLNTRNVTNWIKSLHNYHGGNMLNHLIQCNITGLPKGVGKNDSDLYTFFQNHLDRIRSFAKAHQSHKFIEFDIESHDAGKILGDAFGINYTCWGQANKSIK